MLTTLRVHSHKTIISLWTWLRSKKTKKIYTISLDLFLSERNQAAKGKSAKPPGLGFQVLFVDEANRVMYICQLLFCLCHLPWKLVWNPYQSLFSVYVVGWWVLGQNQTKGKQNNYCCRIKEAIARTETKSDSRGPTRIN